MRKPLIAASVLIMATGAAWAENVATFAFIEADPADRFVIKNVAPCPDVRLLEVSMDLSRAAARVFFDPEPGGPGYDDSRQQFEYLEGGNYVTEITRLEDGGTALTMKLQDFGTGSILQFVLDVDDAGAAVEGAAEDVIGPALEGAVIAALIVNAQGEERAEAGALDARGTGSVSWEAVCEDPG
ncbi:hypothetical protein [Acuticoccus sp.]|uniref:hypothetical protein n=1 Tax=Acuticoccus sp. TaxID=1904378 RepID=UPI003B52FA72